MRGKCLNYVNARENRRGIRDRKYRQFFKMFAIDVNRNGEVTGREIRIKKSFIPDKRYDSL